MPCSAAQDFARLGVGIQLYFFTTKFLIIPFSILTILSIPAMMLNSQENGGKAFSQAEREFMNQSTVVGIKNYMLISTSLGGQGVSRNTLGFDQRKLDGSEPMTPQFAKHVECRCKVGNSFVKGFPPEATDCLHRCSLASASHHLGLYRV